jgi:DNA-binding transcriptional ArsR family regulator
MSSTDRAPQVARSIAHPLRIRIISALDGGAKGLDALAAEVGADRRTVARHARILERAGLLCSMRTSRGTTYELARLPFFDDTEYGSISTAAREAAVAATLAHTQTTALAALEAGGFERTDIHLSRTSLSVTEEQWRTLTDEFAGLLDRIEELHEEAEREPEKASVDASAILMLFERAPGGGGRVHDHDDEGSFSADEALTRSWGMCEDMLQSLTAPRTDWALVASLADQLRVVAAAAHAAEAREQQVPVRDRELAPVD